LQSAPGIDSQIIATDLIANYSTGIIKGAAGSDGGDSGGQGSAIIMDSYTTGTGTTSTDCSGLIFNAGTIQAGKGGNAYLQGGNGGALTVNACEIMQAGFMVAGGGGNADAYPLYWCQDVYGGQGGEIVLGADQTLFTTPQSVTSSGFGGNARVYCTSDDLAHPGAGGNLSAWVAGGLYWGGTANSGGSLYIEPDIMLSGEGTHLVAKEDIVIFGGKDWELHLNNLRPEAVNAGRNIIIAVGEGGIVDLKGNSSKVFKAVGTVEIYADTIMLDDGVKLEDLIEAKEITVKPSKILYHATLNGKQQVKGSVGTTLPVEFNLANGGPQQDTYTLNVTSASGWNMSTLSATVTIAGLTQEKLVIETTLPATIGEQGTITVTATSQTDPTVVATMTAHITTVAEEIKDDEEDENPVPSITITKTGDGNGVVQSRPAGIRCGKTCDKEFPENTTVKLVAFAHKGSIFTGWGGDCSGTTKKTTVTVDKALTCTTNFEVTKPAPDGMYNLTVKVEGEGDGVVTTNGINCAGDCQQNHKRGKNLVLKATPDASSTFVGWSGDCEGMKSPLQVKLEQDMTCVATFQSK
jgi:Divergent InlB B-repeat domain